MSLPDGTLQGRLAWVVRHRTNGGEGAEYRQPIGGRTHFSVQSVRTDYFRETQCHGAIAFS
jgi:hypothetical protein